MKGKETFILYKKYLNTIKKLSLEQRGKLLTLILEYVNDLNPAETNDLLVDVVFEVIRADLKQDLEKWKKTCAARSEAGKQGMANRWKKDSNNKNEENDQQKDITNITKITKDNKAKQCITKITDNDNDYDNDYDNDSVFYNNSENKKTKNTRSPSSFSSSDKENKNRFGKYKRVFLTPEEYEKLNNDYSKDYIDLVIDRLDEYLECNNNKNNYSNFDVLIRRMIRDKWGIIDNIKVPKPKYTDEDLKKLLIEIGDN